MVSPPLPQAQPETQSLKSKRNHLSNLQTRVVKTLQVLTQPRGRTTAQREKHATSTRIKVGCLGLSAKSSKRRSCSAVACHCVYVRSGRQYLTHQQCSNFAASRKANVSKGAQIPHRSHLSPMPYILTAMSSPLRIHSPCNSPPLVPNRPIY